MKNIKKEITPEIIAKYFHDTYEKLAPYTLENLMEHLEKQFNKNMSWTNYGKYWHIEHIKPRSAFKIMSYLDKEFQECWSLNNLRPLEKLENLKKGNRIISVSGGN